MLNNWYFIILFFDVVLIEYINIMFQILVLLYKLIKDIYYRFNFFYVIIFYL